MAEPGYPQGAGGIAEVIGKGRGNRCERKAISPLVSKGDIVAPKNEKAVTY